MKPIVCMGIAGMVVVGVVGSALGADVIIERPIEVSPASRAAAANDAAILGLLDVANAGDLQAGRLAEQKAVDPDVKAFGSRMIIEHKAMQAQSHRVAERLDITPGHSPEAELLARQHVDAMARVKSQSGQAFEQAFLLNEILEHERVINALDQAAREARNPELRRLLMEQALPTLQLHLLTARDLFRVVSSHDPTQAPGSPLAGDTRFSQMPTNSGSTSDGGSGDRSHADQNQTGRS